MVFKLLCSILVNFRENDGIEGKKNSHFTITNGFKRVESTNCRLNSRNTQRVFVILSKKRRWSCLSFLYFWNYIRGSRIAFNLSYIRSRTMYEVVTKQAWKGNSNTIKNT